MAHRSRVSRWLRGILLAAVAQSLTVAPAAAQCVLCYVSASGSGDRGIRTIQIGILILMIPTVAILASLVWTVVRRSRGEAALADGSETDPKWEEELAALRSSPETESFSSRA